MFFFIVNFTCLNIQSVEIRTLEEMIAERSDLQIDDIIDKLISELNQKMDRK